MHHYLLAFTHTVNLWIFWVIWGGFYINGDSEGPEVALNIQVFMIVSSIFFFIIRDKPLRKILFRSNNFPSSLNQEKAVRFASLSSAYIMSILNIFFIVFLWAYAGTVDMWLASKTT